MENKLNDIRKLLVSANFQVFEDKHEMFTTALLEDSQTRVAMQISYDEAKDSYSVSADLNFENLVNSKVNAGQILALISSLLDEYKKYDAEVRRSKKRFSKIEKDYAE